MRVIHSACALLIGNELLSGKVRDENLHTLATELRKLGIPLNRALVLRDDPRELVAELRTQLPRHDLLITSGGVGPTHDDVTVAAVAEAFDVACVPMPEMVSHLQRLYGAALSPVHLRMAQLPAGAELHFGAEGRWPTIVKGHVWMLPGVPELFAAKLATLREHVRGPSAFHTRSIFTQLDEGELTQLLDRVVSAHPDVEVGSYPKWFDPSYKTKITLDSRSETAVNAALQELLQGLPAGEPQRVQ
jgi:molybdenum cofactor synthesis domain-containing protein